MAEITIFTPTYNRAHLLPNLYQSLCKQTNKNFIWLIIDDGSSDTTNKLIHSWSNENIINIKYIYYIYQKNSGKHVAHNKAASICNTELFICVDSDDILTSNAVDLILKYWNNDKNNINFVGYCLRRGDLNGKATGKNWINDNRLISFFDLYEYHKYRGELVLVWITKILKQYQFPEFKNEKFVTENVLYYQISYKQPMKLLNEIIYLFEYKPDGYTKQGEKLYYKNPYGYAIYRYQVGLLSKNIIKKIRWIARYKGWIKTFNLNENILATAINKISKHDNCFFIKIITDIYAKHYINIYTKKRFFYKIQ